MARNRTPRLGQVDSMSVQMVMTLLALMLTGAPQIYGFQAYDCNNASAPLEQYSLLEPEPCPDMLKQHELERNLEGEIVQLKKECLIHTTRCQVCETIQTKFCGFQSRAGATRYIKLREALNVEPADCRLAEKTGRIKINGKEQVIQIEVSTSFHTYLKGGVDINNNCEVGTYEYDGKEYTKQVVLASYELLLRQEWARANDITGMLTMASGVIAPTTDRSIMDSAEGTYVWNHSEESCPDAIVKLYSGPIKVLTNTSSTFNGGVAIVEGRDKNQVAGLELTETFLLCGRAAQKTHIRNIVVFFHPMLQIQVASGKFDAATTEAR
jgi:hypothetical protein